MTGELNAVTTVADVFAVHRWKSMGVASVECECGAILSGDQNMTQFPADEAFRRHLATATLAAAAASNAAAAAADFDAWLDDSDHNALLLSIGDDCWQGIAYEMARAAYAAGRDAGNGGTP